MAQRDKDDLITVIEEESAQPIPDILPLLPVKDVVVFTDMVLPLFVGRTKSVEAVSHAMKTDRYLLVATQMDPLIEDPKETDMYQVGVVARILRTFNMPDGRIKVLIQGMRRAKIVQFLSSYSYLQVKIELLTEEAADSDISLETEALMRSMRNNAEKILGYQEDYGVDIGTVLEGITDPGRLSDLIATNLRLKIEDAQNLLELLSPEERLRKVHELLDREMDLLAVQMRIQSEVKEEINKNQRDYYLREQVRAIHRELGDSEDKLTEAENYTQKIKKAKMPNDVQKEAFKQLKRLEQMHPDSSESTVVRSYLDWMVELPWGHKTKEAIDLKAAQKILDQQHHGLGKIKDRVLEHLSVRKLNHNLKGPILCFVGPPGVGKTSLGKAIAKAMKRKFVRISLGGVRDEAEIRGHRRTYIGAMPGRVLQGLKQATTSNPVFMMDEIDKLGADFRGDPSSALLEVLDPEQNREFSDHYIQMPVDLSDVMFILTANYTDTIPSALLDRMELIFLSGYTEDEKVQIARKYLIPRQLKQNGLTARQAKFTDEALRLLINEYTYEAGLRNLEREIGTVLRKIARKVAEKEKGPFPLTPETIADYLGPAKYQSEMENEENEIGLSTGLAWTQNGGETLYVEVTVFPGKGELLLTGQLGEVMQESARAAISYARSHLKELDLDADLFEKVDIHIHVPAGAIPKDGPSAGTAMATALISVLTGRAVKKEVAMTGEITVRGRILPIGGLKEKALGALRAGITTILFPEKNKKDLVEIPSNVLDAIEFIPVSSMEAVLEKALLPNGTSAFRASRTQPKKKKKALSAASTKKGAAPKTNFSSAK